MQFLRQINLCGNKISGTIPLQFAEMSELTTMDLSSNNMSGSIPIEMPPNLKSLNLAGNKFSGKIPQSLADLPFLEILTINNNEFSGPVPQIGKMRRTCLLEENAGLVIDLAVLDVRKPLCDELKIVIKKVLKENDLWKEWLTKPIPDTIDVLSNIMAWMEDEEGNIQLTDDCRKLLSNS